MCAIQHVKLNKEKMFLENFHGRTFCSGEITLAEIHSIIFNSCMIIRGANSPLSWQNNFQRVGFA